MSKVYLEEVCDVVRPGPGVCLSTLHDSDLRQASHQSERNNDAHGPPRMHMHG